MKCSRPKRPSILMISIRLLSSELQENRPWEIVSLAVLESSCWIFSGWSQSLRWSVTFRLLVHKLLTSYIVIHLSHGTVPCPTVPRAIISFFLPNVDVTPWSHIFGVLESWCTDETVLWIVIEVHSVKIWTVKVLDCLQILQLKIERY